MQFAILIYGAESAWEALTPEVRDAEMAAYFAYSQELVAAGAMRGGEELQPVASARSVRVRDGKAHVLDGPYVDTKEQFGGFFLIDAPSLDEAVAWAAKCPGARHGGVEVRPIVTR